MPLAEVLDALDPAVRASVAASFESAQKRPRKLPPSQVVLVGHRSAGKSRLLPLLAARLGRPALDLDLEIERRTGTPLRTLFERDPVAFREVEREVFRALPADSIVAAGGGFLAHHADLLEGRLAVLVPITFETYRERLRADATRPRLYPRLSLDEEIEKVYREREAIHANAGCVDLGIFLAHMLNGEP